MALPHQHLGPLLVPHEASHTLMLRAEFWVLRSWIEQFPPFPMCFVFLYPKVRLEKGRNFRTFEFEPFVGLREDLGLGSEFGSYLRFKKKTGWKPPRHVNDGECVGHQDRAWKTFVFNEKRSVMD